MTDEKEAKLPFRPVVPFLSMPMIDLRSDTVTQPSAAMRQAMAQADVGDDVNGEDPTVNRLQLRIADLLGKEAALFIPSGTMGNQIAIRLHTRPGDGVLVGQHAHSLIHETGAPAALWGVQVETVGQGGFFSSTELLAAIRTDDDVHVTPTRLVCLENTHTGRVWPDDWLKSVLALAKVRGLKTHLDGARLWNAAVATHQSEQILAEGFDTVSVCLSKGLGAPVGSVLAGPANLIREARRIRKMLGGGMRQVGILAAAGLYALDHHRRRLQHDHDHARLIAETLAASDRFSIDLEDVHTNIVVAQVRHASAHEVVRRAQEVGVLFFPLGDSHIRLVTHLNVDRAACEEAARRLVTVA